MRERRREKRIPEEDKVVLTFPPVGSVAGPHCVALTRDISPGGICLISGVQVPVEGRLGFEVGLAGSGRLVRGTGTVRWVNRLFEGSAFEVGLEFTEIDPVSVGVILEHVYGRLLA